MGAKLIRLTHKIVIQLYLEAKSCTICSLTPGSQSRKFWIHLRIITEQQATGSIQHNHASKSFNAKLLED